MDVHLTPNDPDFRQRLRLPGAWGQGRRPLLLAVAVALFIAFFVAFLVWKARAPKQAAPPAPPPTVTVVVPGTSLVATEINATGTIRARRDMPVGVVGEGGMVTRIRVEAGAKVVKGQILAEIDSGVQQAQLQQLRASVVQATADARLAEAELQRAEALTARGFVSRADIERKTATRDSAVARVRIAEAQVREMQERLERLSIRAPEAGLVLARNIEPGQIVSPASGALYRIAADGEMELRAEVAEQDMAAIKVGQEAGVTPVGSANRYVGHVWLVEPLIDPESRQGVVRILLPEGDELRSGGFATVRIEGASNERPLLPQSAILADRDGPHVLTVGADDVVRRVDVTTGPSTAAGVVVLSGLSGSERVVRSAGAFLDPGEKVSPISPISPRAAAPAAAP